MRENLATLRQNEIYGSGTPYKHIGFTYRCQKSLSQIDVSYIKGMLNNPDIQPGAMVNRWIVGIKLFQFELVHVPGRLHTGLDGLSWHTISPNDPVEEDDADDWLDKTMSFAIVLMNSRPFGPVG